MPDRLIRDLSQADLCQLDASARARGLSRAEYVRRRLRQQPRRAGTLTLEDLEGLAESHADLGDPSVIAAAWR